MNPTKSSRVTFLIFQRFPFLALVSLGCAFSFLPPAHAASGLLLVANKGDQTLGLIDPEAGRMIATVPEEGVTGHEVAASPDGKFAYVPIFGNSGVGRPGTDGRIMRVIDLAERRISATMDFGKGVRPHCVVVGAKSGLLYVTTELENAVTVIDPKTLKIVSTIPTDQPESHMLAVTRDERRAYTANVGPGTVSVLDVEQKKVLAIIPISKTAQRISLSVDDRWVFTSDQTKPQMAVIDTKTHGISRWLPLPGIGYGTAPTPDGNWLVVAISAANKVAVVDLTKMEVAHVLDVPRAPQFALVRPDGAEAYVSCDASKKIVVIDAKEWKVKKLIDAGPGADGLAWANAKP
ncbi:MAG TPA: YncE family protein [Verrucomicrobiae bacterium]|nr:YncE family protein [Verrucomicrobiae bacterium]